MVAWLASLGDAVDREMTDTLARALRLLASRAGQYPPNPPNSRYRRTYTLGRLWTSTPPEVMRQAGGWMGVVDNATPYGPEVQDPDRQLGVHAGRWKTTEDIVSEGLEDVTRILQDGATKAVEKSLGASL